MRWYLLVLLRTAIGVLGFPHFYLFYLAFNQCELLSVSLAESYGVSVPCIVGLCWADWIADYGLADVQYRILKCFGGLRTYDRGY